MARNTIWTREQIKAVAIPVGISVVPFLLLNLWICGRAEDHVRCVQRSIPIWLAGLFFVAGLLALHGLWRLISWASELPAHPQLRFVKAVVLVLCAAGPLLVMARPDMDYVAIWQTVGNRWFVGFLVFVGYMGWAWASVSPVNPVKTWFSVYATIIVVMWLGVHGVFHDPDNPPEGPPPLPDRELLLRNVVFYTLAASAGMVARWRSRAASRNERT